MILCRAIHQCAINTVHFINTLSIQYALQICYQYNALYKYAFNTAHPENTLSMRRHAFDTAYFTNTLPLRPAVQMRFQALKTVRRADRLCRYYYRRCRIEDKAPQAV